MSTSSAVKLRRLAILIHRWMGVAFCVLFVLWFISGIVMMYWYFPGVNNAQRLAHAKPLRSSDIRITPEQAMSALTQDAEITGARINMLGDRPVYRITASGQQHLIFADTGQQVPLITQEQALRIAANWTGKLPGEARYEGRQTEEDQWTVYQAFRVFRPMFKFSWPDGQEIYVSERSGDVAQYTTRGSRLGAYLGAIPHWLYFTPLRKHTAPWRAIVIGLSGIGTLMTLFGIVVGVWLYSPSRKRYRFPAGRSSIPYRGQKRWHTMLGLLFGLFACTWALSGMFSMNPFFWHDEGISGRLSAQLQAAQWSPTAFAAESPDEALGRLGSSFGPVKEIVLRFFAGQPHYLMLSDGGQSTIVVPQQPPARAFPADSLLAEVARASGHRVAQMRLVTAYEPYYVDRDGELPLPAIFVELDDAERTLHYIDPRTAVVIHSYDRRGRWNRWLYHGLHSFDLPWLYRNRPAWDGTVLMLMLGGTALTITSVIIGWRRILRKIAGA